MLDVQIFTGINPRLEMAFEFVDYDLSKYIKIYCENGEKGLSEVQTKVEDLCL